MAKSYKTELNELIVRYGTIAPERKALDKEAKELGAEIKEIMEARKLDAFTALGYIATLGTRSKRELDIDKVKALLGGSIPDDCWKVTDSIVLNVKATENAKQK